MSDQNQQPTSSTPPPSGGGSSGPTPGAPPVGGKLGVGSGEQGVNTKNSDSERPTPHAPRPTSEGPSFLNKIMGKDETGEFGEKAPLRRSLRRPSRRKKLSQPPSGPQAAKVGGTIPPPTAITPPTGQATTTQMPAVPPKSPAVINRPSRTGTIMSVFGILIVAAAAVFFIFFYRATVTINLTPAPDKITVDGKTVEPGTIKLRPGKHDISIEKTGYVPYLQSPKLKINQKLNLSFALSPIVKPALLAPGAKQAAFNEQKQAIDYVGADGKVYSATPATGADKLNPVARSNESFPHVKKILYSDDNTYALILDSSALHLADFANIDVTGPKPAQALPPIASGISSITWNVGATKFVPETNSKIIYDLKNDSGWYLYQADRNHANAQIIMTLEPERFSNLTLDWSGNKDNVIIAGGELGILNLSTRNYQPIKQNGNFVFAKWGPLGEYAIAFDSAKKVYFVKDQKLTDINTEASSLATSFTAANEAVIVCGKTPVKLNFDTGSRINYADIDGVENAEDLFVVGNSIYFVDKEGLKVASFQQNVY